MRYVLTLLMLLPTASFAQSVEDVLAEAAAECTAFDGGVMTVHDGAVNAVELTGDAAAETIIDRSAIECSTAASLWGGTGGSMISVLANGTRRDWLTLGWKVVQMDMDPVLLVAVHGIECNGTGSDPCYEAVAWGEAGFMSIRPAAAPN